MNTTYKSIEIDNYKGKLNIRDRTLQTLNKGEILIKVMCTTIHPADLMFILGEYGDEKPYIFPITPGFEGSGLIVSVGDGVDKSIIGKKASVTASFNKSGTFYGLWAEYHITNRNNIIIFDSDIDYEKIAFTFVNPMTAIGFLDTIRKHKLDAVVQDGASGAFAKMFIKLCQKEGIKNINIVRKPDNISELNQIGATHVLDTSDKLWGKALETLATKLNAKIAFDCVGGNLPGKILSFLPKGSVLYNFGNLEIKPVSIDSSSLIFKDKKVMGWWLLNWLKEISPKERNYWYKYVSSEIENGSDIFLTKISKRFDLKDIDHAIDYYNKNMSHGKIILKPKF